MDIVNFQNERERFIQKMSLSQGNLDIINTFVHDIPVEDERDAWETVSCGIERWRTL